MADRNVGDSVREAFAKIEIKRKKERASVRKFKEAQEKLRACRDSDEVQLKLVALDLLDSRQRIKKKRLTSAAADDDQIHLREKPKKIISSHCDEAEEELELDLPLLCDVPEDEDDDMHMNDGGENTEEEVVKEHINLISSYAYELRSFEGICPVNSTYTAFCLLDIDTNKLTLNERKFVIVERKAVLFGGQSWKWVYMCNTCKHSTDLSIITSEIHLSYEDFQRLQDPCHHCLAATEVVNEFDNVHDLDPSMHVDSEVQNDIHCPIYQIQRSKKFVVVWDSIRNTYGIVTSSGSGPVCRSCTSPSNCVHLAILHEHENCETLPKAANTILTGSSSCESVPYFKSLSNLKIPFHGEKCGNMELKVISRSKECISLKERTKICEICKSSMESSLKDDGLTLFMQLGIFKSKVYQQICTNCQNICNYDGLSDGIINMGCFLVSHTLLRNFMHHFLNGRMPMFTYYTVYRTEMIEMGFNVDQFTYNKFKDTWYAFLELLDVNFQTGFNCSICQDHPRMVIMDATSLSFRKEMLTSWNCFLTRNKSNDKDYIPRTSVFSERVYIPDKRCRDLLERYTLAKTKKGRATPLDYASFDNLRVHLRENHDELYQLFCIVNNRELFQEDHLYLPIDPSVFVCPPVWRPLFLALSCATPVCGLLHNDKFLHNVVDRIAETMKNNDLQHEDDMAVLRKNFPMLYSLIISFPNCKPPAELSPVLKKLSLLSEAPFKSASVVPSSVNVLENPYGYWPALPVVRERGSYEIEKKKKHDAFVCNKLSKGHPVLLPGIFTLFCEHEICYGFEVMLSNESPDVPFTVLFTRFLQAPEYCIYDNCCNLHDYCLNRQPAFFKDTKFLVDRLHWKNHVGCSVGYNMASYPSLQEINSQINEQANSCLKRIKPQLSYMKHVNFMNHCALYIWYRNKKTRERKHLN